MKAWCQKWRWHSSSVGWGSTETGRTEYALYKTQAEASAHSAEIERNAPQFGDRRRRDGALYEVQINDEVCSVIQWGELRAGAAPEPVIV